MEKSFYVTLQFVNVDDETAKAYRVKPGDILFNRTNSYELVGENSNCRSGN